MPPLAGLAIPALIGGGAGLLASKKKKSKSAKDLQREIIAMQLEEAKKNSAKQAELWNSLVAPALAGKPPAYFSNAILPGLEKGFAQAGENLTGFFGRSGQGISGLAAGPWAHLEVDKANSMADASNQAILQSLQAGLGGYNVFDPGRFLGGAGQANAAVLQAPNPWMSLLGGLGAAGLGAVGSIYGNKT